MRTGPVMTKGPDGTDAHQDDARAELPGSAAVPGPDEAGSQDAGAGPGLARRLIGGTSWLALAQMLPLVFNLALTPFVIHGLGVGIYGIFLLVTVIQQFIGSVDGGVGPSARRYFGLYAGQGDRASITSLLVTLMTLVVASASLIVTLFFLTAPQIMAFFPGSAEDPEGATFLLRMMILIVALAQVRGLFTQVLWVTNRFRVQAIGDLLGFFVYAAGMVFVVNNGLGLVGIAWTFVAQQAVTTVVVVPSALRLLDRHAVRFVPAALLREFFGYAWKIQVSGMLSVVAAQGDAIFVGRLAAPQMTAFGTGSSFAATLRGMPMNASTPMEASIVRAVGAVGVETAALEATQIQRLWVRIVAGWIAVGAPAAGFGVTAWLHLGTDLPGQVAAVMLLAHGVTLLLLIQRFWLNAQGRSGLTMSHDILSTVINLSLTFPLILAFGVLGTISATLFAAVTAAIFLTWVGQRKVGTPIPTPWSQIPWINAIAASVVAFLSSWAVAHFVTGVLVPYGALSLLVVGLSAAPALVGYFVLTIGPRRSRELLGRLASRGR